jgi:3-hydroxyisobutyrate dehydrogenase-like beta-hydroxyacid dehydrogenase
MSSDTTLGYIGLGAMGGAMARNLIRKGRSLVVFDIDERRRAALGDEGAAIAATAAEVAAQADVVFTSLPGAPEVEEVYLGVEGVAAGLRPGVLAVEMSTVPPETTRAVAAVIRDRGGAMIDAPVARAKQAAEAGTLAIMVGGEAADYERALPYLDELGTTVIHVGGLGAGNIAKLVNNAVLMANVLVAAEGLAAGARAGADVSRLVDVLVEGSADSFALRNHIRDSVLDRRFEEGRFPLDYALKDIEYFFEMADAAGATCPELALMGTLYKGARGLGFSREYFPVAVQLLEQMNDVRLAR